MCVCVCVKHAYIQSTLHNLASRQCTDICWGLEDPSGYSLDEWIPIQTPFGHLKHL